MRVVHYQIASATTGTATGQGIQNILRDGRIVGVVFRFRATGGGGNGFYAVELGINSFANASAETGSINRLTTAAAATFHCPNASPNAQNLFIPTNWPVRTGDSIAMNQLQTGTAAASMAVMTDVYVEEAN